MTITCLMLAACARTVPAGDVLTLIPPNGAEVRQPPLTIQIEIADEPAERERGLMNRTAMDADAGMLFIFEVPQVLNFWMKNTLIPLDILYFDADQKLVAIRTMEPCTADPCAVYSSDVPVKYALEVNKGYAEEHGVGIGWKLQMSH